MKKLRLLGLLLVFMGLVGLISSPLSFAYETVDVSKGGSFSGRITLEGRKPSVRIFSLVLYPFGPFCKKISDGKGNVKLKEFIVDKNKGLWEAVVSIKKVTKGKAYRPTQAEFVAVDCMFHPADVANNEMFVFDEEAGFMRHEHPNVAIIHNHERMNMINLDPVIHNIQVFQNEKGNIILNTPLPPAKIAKPGEPVIPYKVRGGVLHYKKGKHISQMICGMHEFMQSWGYVVDNPYYAKTAKDGTYKIDGLLPGTYTVNIWHPQFKVYHREITIEANKTSTFDFAFNGNLIRRPEYEKQKQFRISVATPEDHRLHEGEERIIID